MGCCGSSQGPTVEAARKRLSVGHVEGGGEATVEANEQDRGQLAVLNEHSILEMVQEAGPGGRKFSIGSETDKGQTSFANKAVKEKGDKAESANLGLGYTCRKGLKPESPNQDSWTIIKVDGDFSIYGVFDGHGQKGHDISEFVKNNLPKLIIQDKRFAERNDMAQVLKDAFKKVQSFVAMQVAMKKLDANLSGTTATVAIHNHQNNKLWVAHVADSTGALGISRGEDIEALQLTRDHKPDLKDERARIESAGGRVVFDGYANHRIYAKNGRYPGLNMSRCLGDLMGHQDCGITAEPEVLERKIEPTDKLLLLCSDGVWEFISPQEAVSMVNEQPPEKAMVAAEKLAKAAWDKWIAEEGGAVVDDITVVLVHLQARPP